MSVTRTGRLRQAAVPHEPTLGPMTTPSRLAEYDAGHCLQNPVVQNLVNFRVGDVQQHGSRVLPPALRIHDGIADDFHPITMSLSAHDELLGLHGTPCPQFTTQAGEKIAGELLCQQVWNPVSQNVFEVPAERSRETLVSERVL